MQDKYLATFDTLAKPICYIIYDLMIQSSHDSILHNRSRFHTHQSSISFSLTNGIWPNMTSQSSSNEIHHASNVNHRSTNCPWLLKCKSGPIINWDKSEEYFSTYITRIAFVVGHGDWPLLKFFFYSYSPTPRQGQKGVGYRKTAPVPTAGFNLLLGTENLLLHP